MATPDHKGSGAAGLPLLADSPGVRASSELTRGQEPVEHSAATCTVRIGPPNQEPRGGGSLIQRASMGGGSSKNKVSAELTLLTAATTGSPSVTFNPGPVDICPPARAPADASAEQGMGSRGVKLFPRSALETTGGVTRTITVYDKKDVEKGELTESQADIERLARTVWIANIPLNHAIPEKLMEVFEATAVPQVAKVRIKESAIAGHEPTTCWGLLTFKFEEGSALAAAKSWAVENAAGDSWPVRPSSSPSSAAIPRRPSSRRSPDLMDVDR